ncbi:MAG TPA: hypothetical protein VF756_03375 [Thermoanaerobaculia bacterium]
MEPSDLRVQFECDPVVFELKRVGGQDRRDVVILVWGAHGRSGDLRIEAEPPKDVGGFHFEVSPVHARDWEDLSDDPAEPVRGNLSVQCSGGQEGEEVETALNLTVRLGERKVGTFTVGLKAGVNHVIPLWKVLREEYASVKPAWKAELDGNAVLNDPKAKDSAKLSEVYRIVHRRGKEGDDLSGLCSSGGGIRSATFSLGAYQGLARVGLLDRFDYLSSVSGGGYIASWLGGWIHRAGGIDKVLPELRISRDDPARPEAPPITHLRQFSNYLTPKLGLLSADSWTLGAIIVRNLILNLLVLIPVLAAFLALPLLSISTPRWVFNPGPDPLYWTGVLLGGTALFFMSLLRASTRPQRFLGMGLLPLLAAAPCMLIAVQLYGARRPDHDLNSPEVIVRCLIWSVVVPMVAFIASVLAQKRTMGRQRASLKTDLLAQLVSGLVEAAIYFGILKAWIPPLLEDLALGGYVFVILGPLLFFGPLLLGKTLFIALASVIEGRGYSSELGDADREWWARWSGWILLTTLLWMASCALVLYGPILLHTAIAKISAAVTAGGLGALTSWLGKGSDTRSPGSSEKPSAWKSAMMALAAPLFCLALVLLVSIGTQELLRALPQGWTGSVGESPQPFKGYTVTILATAALLFGFGSLMGRFVNVNRFSLQAMYRNRLVRAYLGATNRRRRPNLFTGFDPNDNLRMHSLKANKPFPLINMCLNLTTGEELGWQQRQGESFTATPLHCGTGRLGYRRAQIYGGEQGMSLGTAVATSGAAANSSMGYNSSPVISFIMTIFNARLGAWFGNPGPEGVATYTRNAPGNSARLLLDEALGQTDGCHPYVNMSDGGHFDNLGLYEMVRRRCRFIVVCDAGRDTSYTFEDLGNAIRRIRVDFGISIDFDDRINIFPKTREKNDPEARYCAVGTIRYDSVDGDGNTGTLIYVKPAICDKESYDIYHYAKSSLDFPHESTSDQWFDESQFESYRALGRESILTMTGKGPNPVPFKSFADFTANVRRYVSPVKVSVPASAAPLAASGATSPVLPGGAAPAAGDRVKL